MNQVGSDLEREMLALAFAERALEIIDGCGPDGVDAAMKRVAVLRERAAKLAPHVFGEREAGGDGNGA